MCNCEICQRSELFHLHLQKIEDLKEREFWENIWLALETTELDLDVARAIIDGTWPDADKIILERRIYVEDLNLCKRTSDARRSSDALAN